MKEEKRILGSIRKTLQDYDMIKEGEKIAVGLSGGKDSLTLLFALAQMRMFYPVPYSLVAILVDVGFPGGSDFSDLQTFCDRLNVPLFIEKTDIYSVVFTEREEENPCSLCAKMRRGALYGKAKELGCRAVALGHHMDDVADTLLLNLFYEGRFGCFEPKTELDKTGIRIIRPMIALSEKKIAEFARESHLPILASKCPENKQTEREEMKKLVDSLEGKHRGVRHRIYKAICKANLDGFSDKSDEKSEE